MTEDEKKKFLDISARMRHMAREQRVSKDWVLTGPTTFEQFSNEIEDFVEECGPWAVIQSEVHPGDGYASGMWSGFTVFDNKSEAVEFVEDVIRDEWTTTITIPTEEDQYNEEMLADHKGYCDCDSVKASDVYYSDDGTIAWSQMDDGVVKLIKAVPMKPKGERTNTLC